MPFVAIYDTFLQRSYDQILEDVCLQKLPVVLALDRAERDDPARLDAWQRQYRFAYALVRNGSPFDGYLDRKAGWRLVRRSGPAALYRLVDPAR